MTALCVATDIELLPLCKDKKNNMASKNDHIGLSKLWV